MNRPGGILVPAAIPFAESDLELDEAAFARHLAFLASGGADGVVVLGTNGEFHSLDLEEKRRALSVAAANRGRLRLLACTGASSCGEAAAIAKEAARLRFDALLLASPSYPRDLKTPGIAAYCRTVIEAGDGLPAYLYHIPRFSGVSFDRPLVEALLPTGRVAGVKDSTGSPESLATYRAAFPDLDLLVGSDSLVLAGRRAGAAGAVTGVSNVFPELVRRVWTATEGEAAAAQETLSAVRSLCAGRDLPSCVKAMLALRGLGRSRVRPPLTDLAATEVEEIRTRLTSLGLLPDAAVRASARATVRGGDAASRET